MVKHYSSKVESAVAEVIRNVASVDDLDLNLNVP
jgi:hypothetical protein